MCPSTLTQIVGLILSETRLLTSLVTDPDVDQIVLALKTVMLLGKLTIRCNNFRSIKECLLSTRAGGFGIRK